MFRLDEALKVYLHREPIDFRLNINGLALLVDILNPERIVLGSIFGRQRALLEPLMAAQLRAEPVTPQTDIYSLGVLGYHDPGADWTYGVSTDVLGGVVEVASGQSFESFLDEHVLVRQGQRDIAGVVRAAERLPLRVLRRVEHLRQVARLVELGEVTHFAAKDKYVFMHTGAGKEYIVAYTIAELEQQLDPQRFVRVHRSTLLNVEHIKEIHDWFGGKYRVILDDKAASEIVMSKGMAANLKAVVPF